MTRKTDAWAAAAGVATALTSVGFAIDRRAGTRPVGALAGAGAAALYLAGTFDSRTRLFGRSVTTESTGDAFALTFDDGPDPRYTSEISRLLAERGHRATFFVLGRAVRAYPAIAAQVIADGHEVASHGDDHRLLAFSAPREIRRQIAATEDAVQDAAGRLPEPFFRPPHGIRSAWLTRTVESCGYRVCAWDGSVFDTAQPGSGVIASRVGRLLRPGAIILLHDGDGTGGGAGRSQTVEALPAILDRAEGSGLRSVALGALVRAA